MVAAASASSNVMPIAKQASVMANGIDGEKPPPGLTSVASATGTPRAIRSRAGAKRPSLRKNAAAGQQRGDDAGPREGRDAVGGDVDEMIRRSRADRRGDAQVRRSPPARRRGCAASGPRACRPRGSRCDSSGVKNPRSQNTSHHSASGAACGNHLVDDQRDVVRLAAADIPAALRARP